MIDYLELLLEEQKQEQEQEETRESSIETDPVFSLPYRIAGQAAAEEKQGVRFESEDRAEEEKRSSVHVLQWEESPLLPNRSYSWAEGLYRESVDAARSAAALRQMGNRMSGAAEPDVGPSVPNAAQLDELFARDARRYDNGFFMY